MLGMPVSVDADAPDTSAELVDVYHGGVSIAPGDTVSRSKLTDTSPYWQFHFTSWPGGGVVYGRGFVGVFRGTFGNMDGGVPQFGVNYDVEGARWVTSEATRQIQLSVSALGLRTTPSGTYTAVVADADSAESLAAWFAAGGGASMTPPAAFASLTFTYDAVDTPEDVSSGFASLAYEGKTIHPGDTIYRDDLTAPNAFTGNTGQFWETNFTWPNQTQVNQSMVMLFRGAFGDIADNAAGSAALAPGENFALSSQSWGTTNDFGKYFDLPPLSDASTTPGDYTMLLVERDPKYVPPAGGETVPPEANWFASGGADTSSTPPIRYATLTFHFVGDRPLPEVALSSLSFSSETPQEGSALLVSGSLNATTSASTIVSITETASPIDSSFADDPTGCGMSVSYATSTLNAAIAASADGSFTDVAVPISECGNAGALLARATAVTLTIVAKNAAGKTATSSLTAALPEQAPRTDSVLFIPGTEASRLYYRDLLGFEHQVWEPRLNEDVEKLAFNSDGTSMYDVYAKSGGIVDALYGNNALLGPLVATLFGKDSVEVYGDFETFMDGLVASTTLGMHEWRSYPYDWRYGVRDVVENGTETELQDGTVSRVYLEDVVGDMASSSATGKIAIVAHSNGGLIAKALMQKLAADGKSNLVDKLILVGSPQWGTPSALDATLHADNFSMFPSFVVRPATARAVMANMLDPYDLLPSAAYFSNVASPVAVFSATGTPSAGFASAYGATITASSPLMQFLEDAASLDAGLGGDGDIRTPEALRADLVGAAQTDHDALDSWTPPPGLSVTAIAGWGQMTSSGLSYWSASTTECTRVGIFTNQCTAVPTLFHAPILTQDGDGTVVSPSAIGDIDNAFYFNAKDYTNQKLGDIFHQDLTSATPVQSLLLDLFQGINSSIFSFVSTTTPTGGLNPLSVISSHSPVDLLVTDSSGNQSGVVPISGTDFSGTVHNIPDSSVFVEGGEEYVYVPPSGTYQVAAVGYAEGPAAIDIGTISESGAVTQTQSFSEIPVVSGTVLSLSVNADTNTASGINIDENGDGTIDASLEASAVGQEAVYVPLPADNTPATPTPSAPAQTPVGGGGPMWPAPVFVEPAATTTTSVATSSLNTSTTTLVSNMPTTTPRIVSIVTPPVGIVAGTSTQNIPSPAVNPPSRSPQTAAVYNALPGFQTQSALREVYDWFINAWSAMTHFLTSIL
ncbi:MAG: hypothetical protein KGI73_02835 [Patescibacteria group bacterium]|nr:hypothetical protein [Patescibacteria group bacterium]